LLNPLVQDALKPSMKNTFVTISFLFFLTGLCFSQEPPEMLNFRFVDSTGKIIYPYLKIIETNIIPSRRTKNSKDFDYLKIERDTLEVVGLTKDYNHHWMRIDSTGYFFAPMTEDYHYLGEEIRITGKYNGKVMTITFLGQGMENFGCWASDMSSKSLFDISFEEGNFLYFKTRTTKGISLHDSTSAPNISSKLYKGRISKDFRMIDNLIKIDSIHTFRGQTYQSELLPINELLDFNNEYYGEPTYIGFLFEKNIPVGYCLINNEITKAVLFNLRYQKLIKKYYHQHGDG